MSSTPHTDSHFSSWKFGWKYLATFFQFNVSIWISLCSKKKNFYMSRLKNFVSICWISFSLILRFFRKKNLIFLFNWCFLKAIFKFYINFTENTLKQNFYIPLRLLKIIITWNFWDYICFNFFDNFSLIFRLITKKILFFFISGGFWKPFLNFL
jgi:hypothetical protein